jgi:hypothetical protein
MASPAAFSKEVMGKCTQCGADTILYVNGIPLCVKCDGAQKTPSIPPKREEIKGQPGGGAAKTFVKIDRRSSVSNRHASMPAGRQLV